MVLSRVGETIIEPSSDPASAIIESVVRSSNTRPGEHRIFSDQKRQEKADRG